VSADGKAALTNFYPEKMKDFEGFQFKASAFNYPPTVSFLYINSAAERNIITRFLTLGFYHQSNPARPLTNSLKLFCIWLRIRRYTVFASIVAKLDLRSVRDTAEMEHLV
jgi:hypothetical protein